MTTATRFAKRYHPAEVDRVFEEIKARNPLPQDMIDRFERGAKDTAAKLA